MLAVSGHHDRGGRRPIQRRQNIEPGHVLQFDIEQDQIGAMRLDGIDGFPAGRCFGGDIEVAALPAQTGQARARQSSSSANHDSHCDSQGSASGQDNEVRADG
jgi:hypothetical protein